MANEATFSVTGYVATQPKLSYTKNGDKAVYMRVGWTPRFLDRKTSQWTDAHTSFVSVICYRKVAENAALCLRRGDPVLVKGTLQVRESAEENGPRRQQVEVVADSIGHDLSRGYTVFNRSHDRAEMTAHERMVAEGREPLPGDRPAGDVSLAELSAQGGFGGASGFLTDGVDGDSPEPGAAAQPGSADELESFDEAEARELLETDEAVPAGAVAD